MKSANQILARDGAPESWLPLMELAVREVFEIMLGSALEPLTDPNPVNCEFTAMVGLAGQLCGVVTMRCTAQSAILMTSRMLNVDPKEAEKQVWDALGEIANMIAGNFKNKLTGMGSGCMLSVPTVISGGDYSFHSLADAGPMEVMFLFERAPVVVALEIHS
ncbi:MAG TPA: chemotaxis protein CheX [Terriglobales bacterium]|jgi:chemotaxis protein CheX